MGKPLAILLLLLSCCGLWGCNSQSAVSLRSQQPKWIEPPGTITAPLNLKLAPGKFSGAATDLVVQGSISSTTSRPYAMGSDGAIILSIIRNFEDLNPQPAIDNTKAPNQ